MGLFGDLIGLSGFFGVAGDPRPMSDEELRAQNAQQAWAMQNYDPMRAVLIKNLQMLTQLLHLLTPEERAQINSLATNAMARLGVQECQPPQRNPEVPA